MEANDSNIRGYLGGKGSLNTIVPFHGEFLVNPAPLEASLNYCSHKCAYCFANLAAPGRTYNETVTTNLLDQYSSRTTLPAVLLQGKYPVVLSNRVDPFATSNYKQSVPLLERLVEEGIPVMLQTRGGRGVDTVLQFLPPSVWYVSITTLNDDIRKAVEPGAPTVQSKLVLINELVGLGHKVVVGLNPLVKEWAEPVEDLLQVVAVAGASGVWVENLHLNNDQINNMSLREVDAITYPILSRAKKRKCAPEDAELFERARRICTELGMEVYSMGQPNRSDFFQPWKDLYPKLYPTMQDVVNYCHDRDYGPGVPIYFDEVWDILRPNLLDGVRPIGQYIGSVARQSWKDHGLTNQMTYLDMFKVIWKDPRIKSCPARMPSFSYMCEVVGGKKIAHVDSNGIPLITFNPEGTLKYWYDVVTDTYL